MNMAEEGVVRKQKKPERPKEGKKRGSHYQDFSSTLLYAQVWKKFIRIKETNSNKEMSFLKASIHITTPNQTFLKYCTCTIDQTPGICIHVLANFMPASCKKDYILLQNKQTNKR